MKIELLFPDACYLGGDIANAEYLAECSGAELVRTGIKQRPAFMDEKIDIIMLGAMTENAQKLARDALKPCLGRIRELIESGVVFLVTGNALDIFGEYIDFDGKRREDMLGLFGYHAEYKMMDRHNSLFIGDMGDMKIVGFKSQFGHCYGCGETPLFEMQRGVGLNPGVKGEGIRVNNFMATYLLGPILLMNPPFAKYVLGLLGCDAPLKHEAAAMEAYELRVKEYSNPKVDVFD